MKGKNIKIPNVEEKTLLKQLGFNPKFFLRIYKDAENFVFLEVQTGKSLSIRR